MILAFEFTYLSHNGILEHLLKENCLDFGIKHLIVRNQTLVTLYVEESEERLGTFADYFSQSLPLSLFFKSSSVYVATEFPQTENVFPLIELEPLFTPKHIKNISSAHSEQYLLPYLHFNKEKETLFLMKNEEKILMASANESLEAFYATLVQLIDAGKCVQIATSSGHFVFGKIDNAAAITSLEGVEIIPTDLSVIEKMVVCRENEIKALASLERPAIRFKVNAVFAQKEIVSTNRLVLRLADEWIIYHLCQRLFASQIYFIYKAPATLIKADYRVQTSQTLKQSSALEVCILENGEILIVKGERYASAKLLENSKKFNEASHAAFASILQEHHLFQSNSSCFYLSTLHDDKFMNYTSEHGMLNLTQFVVPDSFEMLFEQIKASSKSAERLVENYKASFPEIYDYALSVAIPKDSPKSIYTLLKIASIALGMSDNFENGAQELIELAEDFGGQKGPRMDYFLEKEATLVSDFDYVRLIRSGMSFKLAGTDNATLSFGYLQSLAYFLSDTADFYKENLLCQNIALAGRLFGCRRLSEMVYKNIKPNHTICLNRELPIDSPK